MWTKGNYTHGGDHRFDDAPRARKSHDHQRLAPPPHRAQGSGTTVQEVNNLLKQYTQMRKMMKSLSGGFLGRKLGKMKLPDFLSQRP